MGEGVGGVSPPIYFQICKKVGQMSAMMQEATVFSVTLFVF